MSVRGTRVVRGIGIVVALSTSIVFCASAAAAERSPLARFDGRAPDGTRSFLELDDGQKALSGYDFINTVPCSDGKRQGLGLNSRGEKRTTIGADGTFSYDSGTDSFRVPGTNGKLVAGRGSTTFSGRIDFPDVATVTVTSTFESKRLRCRGSSTLTLYRGGSPQQPLEQNGLVSGQYISKGRGIEIRELDLAAPGRQVTAFRYFMKVPCQGGLTYIDAPRYSPFALPFRAETEARLFDRQRIRVGKRRLPGREQVTVRMRFFLNKRGQYRVAGRVTTRARLRVGGRQIRCFAPRAFTGRNGAVPDRKPNS